MNGPHKSPDRSGHWTENHTGSTVVTPVICTKNSIIIILFAAVRKPLEHENY